MFGFESPAVLAKDQRHVDAEHHRGEAEIAQQRTLRQVRAVDAWNLRKANVERRWTLKKGI